MFLCPFLKSVMLLSFLHLATSSDISLLICCLIIWNAKVQTRCCLLIREHGHYNPREYGTLIWLVLLYLSVVLVIAFMSIIFDLSCAYNQIGLSLILYDKYNSCFSFWRATVERTHIWRGGQEVGRLIKEHYYVAAERCLLSDAQLRIVNTRHQM